MKIENGSPIITARIKGLSKISQTADFRIDFSSVFSGTVKTITARTLYKGRRNAKIIVAFPSASFPNRLEIKAKPIIA